MVNEMSDSGVVVHRELPAGPDRLIVVYQPPDFGTEVDPAGIMAAVAADAERRSADGWRIASIDSMNLRHSGLYVGRQGSGYESKAAVIVLYARS